MASNTQIFIKRSEANSAPGSLRAGELAYSYASNTLFIGANTQTGPGYLAIGGQFYTNVVNQRTSSNVSNTLVFRDAEGNFAAGNITARYIIGDGSALTNIPSLLNITGDTGSNAVHMLTETLNFAGGEGITSTVTGDEVTFDVDDTVFRANSGLSGAVQFVDSPVVFTGNVTFTGNSYYNNVTTLNIADPIIYLAANNYSGDSVDIGFAANYFDGTDSRHTGLFRHNSDKHYYLFQNYLPEPGDSNIIDPLDASFEVAYLHAELKGNVSAHEVSGNVTANTVTSNSFRAFQGIPNGENGYSFVGDGGYDTGMFSTAAGELEFYSNNNRIVSANSDIVFFEKDLKLANSARINNPTGLLELNPDETNADDRYIVIDPTSPNHIHLRAGGTIDASDADLFLGGEQNYVKVSDTSDNVEIFTNNLYGWEFTNDGKLLLANGTSIYDSTDGNNGFYVDPIRANNAIGGNVTAYNTTTKELVSTDVKITNAGITLANGTVISDGENGFFVNSLAFDPAPLDQANIVLYNATTGEITYGPIADLNPAQLANGSHSWTVSDITGALYSDQGTSLACSANSVVLGPDVDVTNSNTGRVAIGWYAGSTSQSQDAIAIGNSAGRYNQGDYSVAIGAYAGDLNQADNSIILNASGFTLDAATSGFYVNPIAYTETQNNTYDGLVFFNSNTKEVRYSYTLDGGAF